MSSLRKFVVVRVLRPVGRALIAYGMYWVWVPGVRQHETLPSEIVPRGDGR
ncbi:MULTISPECIES: hypothetical protein [Streptomyces]|uniref:Uncharacterized protein n=1 Tax=Streptomyces chengmaiensis TaxID=3040919 RepID=A0ABT6HSB3_9ACTN|nr:MULTISPECIES: hypothetical protein [Streptomyces]MDH2390769.1 hypothetical protein [Streptomyces chengmaiensis]WRQ80173.1 hypothetical protein I3F59_012870 [Streptomyces sp. MUM 178J]